ncbi:DUF6167 family protein [Nocardioides deserti]|uniref:YtxH domain-containing protein n=1 Tax=Nocardioides deserti TaxID=1588644 RepID=A0ABR6U610_9ACTN|nr:DUF6167 family protein [Nocardioides deserti]MBC2959866.1 hypothetical protein [Nocardioides deserti]GGO75609.1 hypothetical protein GCM10012276_26470 [Nocardioides deserti]
MSRGLWFVAGAGAGVYAMVRGRRAAEALTADGLRDRWNGLAHGARLLRDEVAQGRADAEVDLRARLGLTPAGTPELAAPAGPTAPPTDHTDTEAPNEEGTT